jgi:hypothetical protein
MFSRSDSSLADHQSDSQAHPGHYLNNFLSDLSKFPSIFDAPSWIHLLLLLLIHCSSCHSDLP